MAIALRGSSSSQTASSTSHTPALPAGVTSGDLIILFVFIAKTETYTGPTGYTQIGSTQTLSASSAAAWYKIAGAGETDPTYTVTTAATADNVLMVYSGVDGTTPLIGGDTTQETDGDALCATPIINNTDAGAWAVACYGARQVPTPVSWTPDAALTERQDFDSGRSGTGNVGVCGDDSNGTITTGNKSYTVTCNQTSNQIASMLAILKPAGAGGSTFPESPTDAVGITDSATVISNFARPQTDSVGITDGIALTQGLVIGSDFVDLSDAVFKTVARALPVESVGITDFISIVKASDIFPVDPVGITDSITLDRTKGLAESVGITDSVAITRKIVINDSVGLADSVIASAPAGHSPIDIVGITDSVIVDVHTATHYLSSQSIVDYARQQAQTVLVLDGTDLTINDLGHKYWNSKSILEDTSNALSIYDHYKSLPTRRYGRHWVTDME